MYIFPVNYVPSSKEEISETSMPEAERRLILSKLHTCACTWKYYIKKLQRWSNVLRFDHIIKSELFRYQFIQIYEYSSKQYVYFLYICWYMLFNIFSIRYV